MKTDIDVIARLSKVVEQTGTQTAAAAQLGLTQGEVSILLKGRRRFSDETLAKLGLRRTVIERTK